MMKYAIVYVLLMFSSSLKSKESIPDYSIIKSQKDKTLKQTEAVFRFTFLDSEGTPIKRKIQYSYNNVNEKNIPDKNGKLLLRVKPGKYVFQFFYNADHYEIYTDTLDINPAYLTEININFRRHDYDEIQPAKPVIYVYSNQKEKISIKLKLQGDFTFTYPHYSNGWNFIANPDGKIEMADKTYHYLFWDGTLNVEKSAITQKDGFIVGRNELMVFFEEKLNIMGFNSQEIEDFITYWCPRMNVNDKNYIHFMFNEEYNKYAFITIDPEPDRLFRMCMLWSNAGTTDKASVTEQKLETFNREGFTVVEWGGAEIEELSLN